jgi:hypothetical protein
MTNQDVEQQIRQICTYHSDEGTSGYCLSEEQFKKVFDLFTRQLDEVEEKIKKQMDSKYPPNRFIDSYTGEMSYGVQEETYIRLAKKDDLEKIAIYNSVLQIIQEMRKVDIYQ